MEYSGVHKKINRYIYKSLRTQPSGIEISEINDLVKYYNRNNCPITDMRSKVKQSLNSYESHGIIRRTGNVYSLAHEDDIENQDSEGPINYNNSGINYDNYERNNIFDDSINGKVVDDDYRTKSLSSIPPPDLKRKKRRSLGYSDDDNDNENVESHRKRRKIVTVLDGRTKIKQENSAKNDPKGYPEDITCVNSPSEGNEVSAENASDDDNNALNLEEPINTEGNNENQFEPNNELGDDIRRITETSIFGRSHSYFYLN